MKMLISMNKRRVMKRIRMRFLYYVPFGSVEAYKKARLLECLCRLD